jgi:hypothetical protein
LAAHHLNLIRRIAELVPEQTAIVLLGDGEFSNVLLAGDATRRGWFYVFRTSCDDTIELDGEQYILAKFRFQWMCRVEIFIPILGNIYYKQQTSGDSCA